MPCKTKLGNLPSLSDIDNAFKKLISTKSSGGILSGLKSIASSIEKNIENQVKNVVNEATGKLNEIKKLVGNLSSEMKAGITDDLSKIKPGVLGAINSVKDEIAKEYNSVKEFLKCEFDTTSSQSQDTQQTNKIQTSVNSISVDQAKSFSNKDIKNISEDPAIAKQTTTKMTNDTINQGAVIVAANPNNNQEIVKQNNSLNTLQTL